MAKYILLKDWAASHPDADLPTQTNLITWVKQGILDGYQLCRCFQCDREYALEKFETVGNGWTSTQSCPNCKSMVRSKGEWYVLPVNPKKIVRPKRGRRWPVKGGLR